MRLLERPQHPQQTNQQIIVAMSKPTTTFKPKTKTAGPEAVAPATGSFAFQGGQVIFELDSPDLGFKTLGQASGSFPSPRLVHSS